jgi:hypothetical protein
MTARVANRAGHKLVQLIYAMLTQGEEQTDRGQVYCEERYRQRVVAQRPSACAATPAAGGALATPA